MRDFTVVIVGSSILLPPNPTPPPHHLPKSKPKTSSISTTKPSPSNSSSSSSSRPPLLSTVPWDLAPRRRSQLRYYADLASKLAENGKLEEFLMVAESVVASGLEPRILVRLLNTKLVSVGIERAIVEGNVWGVVEVLSGVRKLGISPIGLFDDSVKEAIARECYRIFRCGEGEEVVELMETFAGFDFAVKELADPSKIIQFCVDTHNPNLAIRYARIFSHEELLFCDIIHEFGKKQDLVSALTIFEASKQRLSCPSMFAYRTMIDVCGLCRDYLKSRSIYEELLAQKVTPNIYIFNSLMNVNAHDLSYTLNIYKHMQNLGVAADVTSYNILLKSSCLAARTDVAHDIYREVQQLQSAGLLKLDVFTYSTIIKVLADAKLWRMALRIKEDMQSAGVTPNKVTYSSLIGACANAGVVEQALQLFEEMLLVGCEPNSQCCNVLLHACVEAFQYDRAFRLFRSWKESGFQKALTTMPNCAPASNNPTPTTRVNFTPTTTTYNILMKACGTDYFRAKALMDEMQTVGLSPNHISWSTLIGICGSTGNVNSAMKILNSMREAGVQLDVITYTTAIKVCVENRSLKIAFSLFAEMKRYQIQPNLVTYNTLLRARTRYGSLHQVQQCLAIYQDMRKAGYTSNDYYLKQLIEEWCEGVIQGNDNQNKAQLSSCSRSTDLGGPQSLLLEKVAAHLQKSNAESLGIDLQGLTKVEARIVVLAVLRMIKEKFTTGGFVKDDMFIILGIQELPAAATEKPESNVEDAITKLLRDELGLKVLLLADPKISIDSEFDRANMEEVVENGWQSDWRSSTRRPAVLRRLRVTRKSLNNWLQRRVGAFRR